MAKKSDVLGLHRIKNSNVKRNVFDLSRNLYYTQALGQLLPCFVEEVMPNDRLSLRSSDFVRTSPLQSNAYATFRHNVQFFFVPYVQLWKYFREVITNTSLTNLNGLSESNVASSFTTSQSYSKLLPRFSLNSLYKQLNYRGTTHVTRDWSASDLVNTAKLLELLEYGDFHHYLDSSNYEIEGNTASLNTTWMLPVDSNNIYVSPFRLMAYQKICSDYYRMRQWVGTNPSTFNCDYISPNGKFVDISSYVTNVNGLTESMFTMQHATLPLNYFTGCLPRPQFGSTASASVNVSTESVDVSELRNAFALQRYKEIQGSNDVDYISQIEAHFGFRPKVESSKCTFIGGFDSDVVVNTIVNTNLQNDSSTVLGGVASCSSNGTLDFTAPDYGVVIGISSFVPDMSFPSSSLDRRNTLVSADSYPIPELDSIGMQELRMFEFSTSAYYPWTQTAGTNFSLKLTDSAGYVPRYFEWKCNRDRHCGEFEFSLANQVLGFKPLKFMNILQQQDKDYYISETPSSVNTVPNFLQVHPDMGDSVFTNNQHILTSDDNFMIAMRCNCTAVRSLSVYGLPDCN